MVILVVGADKLGNIPNHLQEQGAKKIVHWNGRAKSFQNRKIPKEVDKILIFCDFINHNLMNNIRKQSKSNNIPVVYGRRSLIAI